MTLPHRLLDDIETPAGFNGWSEDVYRDFFRLRQCIPAN